MNSVISILAKFARSVCFTICFALVLVTTFSRVSAQNSNGLPENIPAPNCQGCQPLPNIYTCPHEVVQGVPRSYDVDNDRFVGNGDLLLVDRYLQRFGPGPANGAREDANGDGVIDAKDASDLQAFFAIVVGNGGSVPDICGICGGDGTSCLDCAGTPKGDATIDACGVCGGPGIGECGCDLTIKKDCAGECGGTKTTDECGVCGGAGKTGCDLHCQSTAVEDSCGVCGGNGPGECGCDLTVKKDCNGVCGGSSLPDACGVCGGNGPGECGCNLSIKKDCKGVCGGTAVVDSCGVCGGSGPGECGCNLSVKKDCKGVCGGTSVLDECGVCGGNGSTCQECDLYEVKTVNVNGTTGLSTTVGTGATLDCVKAQVGSCTTAVKGNLCDDNLTAYFMRKLSTSAVRNDKYYTYYMDKNCNPVTNFSHEDICGDLQLRFIQSPVSLLWDGAEKIEKMSIAQFPLGPNAEYEWYLWKASAQAPLVVYDPEHKGSVTSYEQLFGDWSFGGKKVASLDSMFFDASPEVRSWKDGYEALASLDANGDKKLTDAELAPIALWFDKNQDGVSQDGEVVSASSMGVVSIFVTSDSKDELTGDVHAKLGYERLVDGKVVQGRSVDWYGEGFTNEIEATMKLQARGSVFANVSNEVPFDSSAAAKPNMDSVISGPWLWQIDESFVSKDALELAPKGVLSFKELEDGSLVGRSIVEIDLKKQVGDATKFMAVGLIKGTVTNSSSSPSAEFSVASSDGSNVKSVMQLQPDGKTLKGTTTMKLPSGGKDSSTLEFSYSWTATRM